MLDPCFEEGFVSELFKPDNSTLNLSMVSKAWISEVCKN